MISRKITCQDNNEAEKLASLIFIKEGNETFINEILNVINNEIVVLLKDKSAHSILLRDNKEVESFADFIQSVIEKQHLIKNTSINGNEVEIFKE